MTDWTLKISLVLWSEHLMSCESRLLFEGQDNCSARIRVKYSPKLPKLFQLRWFPAVALGCILAILHIFHCILLICILFVNTIGVSVSSFCDIQQGAVYNRAQCIHVYSII